MPHAMLHIIFYYMGDVCVHLRVLLVDHDYLVQQKRWKITQDRLGQCIGYKHAEADLEHASSGSHVMLFQHVLSFLYVICTGFGLMKNTCMFIGI